VRTFLILVIIFLLSILLALWSPWTKIDISLAQIFGVEEPDRIAGLQVYSLGGEIDIYVDSEYAGTATQEDSPFIVDQVDPGDRLVRLERKSDIPAAYWEFSKLINFIEGKDVVVSYNIGPEETFSEGHVIYASESSSGDERQGVANLNIRVNAEDTVVEIDEIAFNIAGTTMSETLTLNKQHKLLVSKAGYESLEFTILPESQEDRDKLEGFDIELDVHLMLQPLQVE
jgi:hypothetical protein